MNLLSGILNTQVTLASRKATPSTYGHYTYNTPATYSAHEKQQTEVLRSPDGEEILSHMTVYLESSATPQLTDQLVLSDGSTPRMIDIQEVKDHRYVRHHWKVRCE